MIKRILTYCFILLACLEAKAQQKHCYQPYTPEPLPKDAPKWFEDIYKQPSEVNYFRMDSLFRDWLAQDIDARVKTLERKPSVNFYRRWAKAFRPYVQADGTIALPTIEKYLQKLDKSNQANEAFRAKTPKQKTWRNIGPNATYDKGGKIKDSQVCVYRIAVAPSNHNVVYCGTETGVVFKTTNKGQTWQACQGTHNFGGSIYAIQVAPNDENTIYVGGGINLWISKDGGETWQRNQEIIGRINSIRIAPNNPQHITLCTGIRNDGASGFYRSTDGGQSFEKTFDGVCHDHELQAGNPQRQYLIAKPRGAEHFNIYLSEDEGRSFQKQNCPVSNIVAGRLAVSSAPSGKDYVYALVNASSDPYDSGIFGGIGQPYLLKSTDAGVTWQDQTVRLGGRNPKNTFSPYIDDDNGGQGYFDMSIAVSSQNPEHIIFGLCNAYRSTQGGKGGYWETAIGGYQRRDWSHPDIQDVVVAGKDTWLSTDGGIKLSEDFFSTKGTDKNQGIYASDYHGFAQGWNEDVMAGGRWHNGDVVHASRYGEGNTLHIGGIEWATGHVMLSNPNKVYFSDAGTHIIPKQLSGQIKSYYQEFFNSRKPYETLHTSNEIAFDPRYAKRLIMCPTDDPMHLYLSEDEGQSFRLIFDAEDEFISNYQFSRSNPKHIYLAGIFTTYHTTDDGQSRDMFNQAFDMSLSSVNDRSVQIAVDPNDENTIWTAYSGEKGKVAYTKDCGATWHYPQSDLLKDRNIHWIILTGDEVNGVYLGTVDEASVFYKDDTLSDWIDYSAGLPRGARLTRLTPFYKKAKLRAATNQGIWEIPLYNEKFRPTAQPMILNLGNGDLSAEPNKEVLFDSYSIVNQDDVLKWEWEISPKPKSISNKYIRNPKVVFGYKGSYDVKLTITTSKGSHSRTIKDMVRIGGSAPEHPKEGDNTTSLAPLKSREKVVILSNLLKKGEALKLQTQYLRGKKSLTIHNMKGALLERHLFATDEIVLEVPTTNLSSGVYILELKAEGYRYFSKFIIQ